MRRRRQHTRAVAVGLVAALATITGCTAAAEPPPPPLARLVGAPAPLDPTAVYLEQRIAAMSLEQKVAALLMVHVPGTDPARIRAVIDAHGLGGVILMGDNIGGPAATVAGLTGALSAEAGLPVLTAIDQEGGIVRRLRDDTFAASWELRGAPASAAEQAFADRSALVAEAGVLINFGIVADVTPIARPSSTCARWASRRPPRPSVSRRRCGVSRAPCCRPSSTSPGTVRVRTTRT